MLALMGHMGRAMPERYSHIRMAAKRDAVVGLILATESGKSRSSIWDSPIAGYRSPHFSDLQVIEKNGERGGNRTYNLLIKSQLLCQLSYAPEIAILAFAPDPCQSFPAQAFNKRL